MRESIGFHPGSDGHTNGTTERSKAVSPSRDVALWIDWENLRFSLWKRNLIPNLALLMEAAKTFGRVVIARAYADWLQDFFLKNLDQTVLYHAGIEPVFVPTWDPERKRYRKNSVDIKLSADCMESCYTRPSITRHIFITGDADYLHLTTLLRRAGREVIIVGVSWSTSQSILGQVDQLLFYDRDIDKNQAHLPTPIPAAEPAREANPALERSIDALMSLVKQQRSIQRYPTLAWLGSEMKQAEPGFRHEAHGFSKFTNFVLLARDRGLLQVATLDQTSWAFLPGEPPPAMAAGKSQARSRPTRDLLWNSDEPLEDFQDDFLFLVWGAHQLERSAGLEHLTIDSLAEHLHRWAGADGEEHEVIPHSLRGLDRPSFVALVERSITLGLLAFRYGGAPEIVLNPASSFVEKVLGKIARVQSSDEPRPESGEPEDRSIEG